ncbi:hypothetical protein ES703_77970 [subsurface metagenome]
MKTVGALDRCIAGQSHAHNKIYILQAIGQPGCCFHVFQHSGASLSRFKIDHIGCIRAGSEIDLSILQLHGRISRSIVDLNLLRYAPNGLLNDSFRDADPVISINQTPGCLQQFKGLFFVDQHTGAFQEPQAGPVDFVFLLLT